jgi:CubicO group peptidase (beta-lactamase class C family)
VSAKPINEKTCGVSAVLQVGGPCLLVGAALVLVCNPAGSAGSNRPPAVGISHRETDLPFARMPPEPEASEIPDSLSGVDALAGSEFAKDKVGSLTVGVVAGSKLVWTNSYGYSDMEKKQPATRRSVYRIGSITKQFTALMLLQLVEYGKVHFADPVEKYFPEVNRLQGRYAYAPPITLIQLATMTAGISTEPRDLTTYLRGPVRDWEKVLISALPHTRYVFEPGTRFLYSNIGYAILGAALSRAADQPYTNYVEQHIFAPLGMKQTAFEPNDQIRPDLAKGYAVQGGKPDAKTPEREHEGRGYKVPNGAAYSTVDDLARFVTFELGNDVKGVLTNPMLDVSTRPLVAMTNDLQRGYGIGCNVLRVRALTIYGHAGSVAGYEAVALVDRKTGVGVIALRSASGGKLDILDLGVRVLEKVIAGSKKESR